MNESSSSLTETPIPADDPSRSLVHAQPKKAEELRHIAVAGDVYTSWFRVKILTVAIV